MKQIPLLFILLISSQFAKAQIDFTPYPGNSTHCPGELVRYTATGYKCGTYTWTITSGKILNSSNEEVTTLSGSYVDIRWDNVASTGKLKVTSTCDGSFRAEEKSFAIRSLTGRVPQNLRYDQVQPYCSASGVNLAVNVMFLDNTGGTTGVLQQRADGYEWTLPSGWKSSGTGGTISTVEEFVYIIPDNGCVGGTVTVKAFKNCGSGKKYSSSSSININRPSPAINVTPPSGYVGPSCGAVQSITFSVTPISCATNYLWVFPSGWLQSPVYTTTNTITVTPSGGELDAGNIQVTVNLNCGSQLPSIPYQLNFVKPSIAPASAICFGGTNVTLSNIAPTVNVNWSVSNNMIIVAGQGTSNVILRANAASTRAVGAINAVVSCPNTTVPQKTTWVGMPNQIVDILKGSGTIAIGATVPFSIHDPNNISTGLVSYDWDVSGGYFAWIDTYAWTTIDNSSLVLYAGSRNACGSLGMISRSWNTENPGGCPPGEICEMSVYPNPSSDELTVSLASNEKNSVIAHFKLSDSNGAIVYSTAVSKGSKDVKIPTQDLKNGTYYLSITQGGKTKQRQIIVRH